MVGVDKDIKNIQNVNQFFKSFLPVDPLKILFSHPDAVMALHCRAADRISCGNAGCLPAKLEGSCEESGCVIEL
jgi:hypothetical protein